MRAALRELDERISELPIGTLTLSIAASVLRACARLPSASTVNVFVVFVVSSLCVRFHCSEFINC